MSDDSIRQAASQSKRSEIANVLQFARWKIILEVVQAYKKKRTNAGWFVHVNIREGEYTTGTTFTAFGESGC